MPALNRHLCLMLTAALLALASIPAAQAQVIPLAAAIGDEAAPEMFAGLRELPLDETTLAAQRGRAAGMTMMVSASPDDAGRRRQPRHAVGRTRAAGPAFAAADAGRRAPPDAGQQPYPDAPLIRPAARTSP